MNIKAHLRTGLTDSTTVIDGTTGEILEQDMKTVKYLAASKEEFFIAYTSILGIFSKLTLPEVRVYSYLLENYNVGTAIAISGPLKQIISDKQGISVKTISNALTGLLEEKLLFKSGHGVYKLNPRYAFKGSTKDSNAMLKVILEVECPDC